MRLNILVTDAAIEDALKIAEYLAEHSGLNMSDKFLSAAAQTYRQLAEMPGMGNVQPYRNSRLEEVRMFRLSGFPKYFVFYRATDTDLTVLRVLHGSQNRDGIFNPATES